MKIIKFHAKWCSKCNLFKDVECDESINIDLPSNSNLLLKYQISIIPTFIAVSDNGRVKGKLSNPMGVEDFKEWKKKVSKNGS